jgi:glutamate formiminotransferase
MQACAIYLSTGSAAVASQISACAARVSRAVVVDVFTDAVYSRSSVKIVGQPGPLLSAACAASSLALSVLDLSKEPHPAPHPRCGAVDLVAFMPLSIKKTSELRDCMQQCDELAWKLGASLGAAGCPVLMCVSPNVHCICVTYFSGSAPDLRARFFRLVAAPISLHRCTETLLAT